MFLQFLRVSNLLIHVSHWYWCRYSSPLHPQVCQSLSSLNHQYKSTTGTMTFPWGHLRCFFKFISKSLYFLSRIVPMCFLRLLSIWKLISTHTAFNKIGYFPHHIIFFIMYIIYVSEFTLFIIKSRFSFNNSFILKRPSGFMLKNNLEIVFL